MEGLACEVPASRGWLRGLLVMVAGWMGLTPEPGTAEPGRVERFGRVGDTRSAGSGSPETRSSDVLG